MNKTELKKRIKELLPSKFFKVHFSKSGLIVFINGKRSMVGGINALARCVKKMKKALKAQGIALKQDCFGYDDNIASWEFININTENEMLFDATQALDAMKVFFKKYGNRYCSSTKVYSIIEKMRALVETDEN